METNQQFQHNILDILTNPFFLYRSKLSKNIIRHGKTLQGTILDFGCGTMPYKHLFSNCSNYIGLDIEVSGNYYTRKPDLIYDGNTIPLENESIDNIFCSEVLEHVFNPDIVLNEMNRVLKPNGNLLLTCPFTIFEHEKPYDYARYSSFGLTHLLNKHGFEIIEFTKTGSYLSTILQLIAAYIYFVIAKIPVLKYFLFIFFITPLFALALLVELLPDVIKRKDLYLNNIVLARKI